MERKDVILADIMCKRKGKKEGLRTEEGYWNRDEWIVFFKQQILAANRLLKIYPYEVVLAAVNNKKANWVYSLFYPGLKQILVDENAKYEQTLRREEFIKNKLENVDKADKIEKAPEIPKGKTSLKNRLD